MMKKQYVLISAVCALGVIFGGCGNAKTNDNQVTTMMDNTTEVSTEAATEEVTTTTEITAENVAANTKVSGDWKSMKFTLNGTEITLPCKYSDIKKAGFDFKDKDESSYVLNPNYVSSGVSFVNDKEQRIVVTFLNDTSKGLAYTECKIGYVSASTLTNDNPDIVLANGVKFGTDYDAVKNGMGKAYYTYEDDDKDFKKLQYRVNEDSSFDGSVEFCFRENKVYEIVLSK